jgi:hypothetical protein
MTSITGVFLIAAIFVTGKLNRRKFIIQGLLAVLLVASQISEWTIRTHSEVVEKIQTQVSDTFVIFFKRIGGELIFGENGGAFLSNLVNVRIWVFIGMVPFVLLLILWISRRKGKSTNQLPLIFITTVFASYFILIIAASRAIGLQSLENFGAAGRYFVMLHILVFVLFVMMLEKLPTEKNMLTKCLIFMIGTLFLFGSLCDFRLHPKATTNTDSSWNQFSNCYKSGAVSCEATIPPGAPWGIKTVQN